jgi:ABC-2 type transport system ATP-binding protein
MVDDQIDPSRSPFKTTSVSRMNHAESITYEKISLAMDLTSHTQDMVQVDRLTKRYGSFEALTGCDLRIQRGCVFGLLGPNGAGKTTMIRCIMGYLKPTSGSAFVDGIDCIQHSLQVRKRVSYLPAESKMFRLMRGTECIEFFASIHPKGDRVLAHSIAKRLELDTSRRVAFMSTGMRQKLAISCVMSCQSQLMILDEPTANLDPTVRAEVLRLVRESNARGATIVFCSHVLDEIKEVCDQAAILKRGRVETRIDLHSLKFVHRISGSVGNEPIRLIEEKQRFVSRSDRELVFEVVGPLEEHLKWISESGLTSIQIESVGLKGIYEGIHPGVATA